MSAERATTESKRLPALEKRLGHHFARPELLRLALTHRSHSYERRGIDVRSLSKSGRSEDATERNAKHAAIPGDDNEQLEFLGDAVLGLVVTEALYREFPHSGEGELTRLRASLVSRKRMGEVGAALGLGDALVLGRSAELVGARKRPALMANAAEAVIGAVYLDGGFEAAGRLVQAEVIAPAMAELRAAVAGEGGESLRDHKTLLQERVQALGAAKLRYVDAGQRGPAHHRQFCVEAQLEQPGGTRVLASAEGPSKKEAQQKAAQLALESWQDAPPVAGEEAAA